LKQGNGPSEYGLQVAGFLMKNKDFIKTANLLKNDILSSSKKSRYNKKFILKECFICKYKPKINEIPLETHHIQEQKNTDKNGFILSKNHIHKNHISNLVSLCHKCHDKIDTKEIQIKGYKNTSKGPMLDYQIIKKN
jgi:DNA mismatch repair protein MutS